MKWDFANSVVLLLPSLVHEYWPLERHRKGFYVLDSSRYEKPDTVYSWENTISINARDFFLACTQALQPTCNLWNYILKHYINII